MTPSPYHAVDLLHSARSLGDGYLEIQGIRCHVRTLFDPAKLRAWAAKQWGDKLAEAVVFPSDWPEAVRQGLAIARRP